MITTTNEHIKLMHSIHADICNEYGYDVVELTLNHRAQKRIGNCQHNKRTNVYSIQLSKKFLETNDWNIEILRALIVHEVAHIKHFNHGLQFTNECIRMGVPANHVFKLFKFKQQNFKWMATCSKCGYVHGMARKPKYNGQTSCGKCCNSYSEDRLMIYKQMW